MPQDVAKKLLAALAKIDRPGTFCVARSVPAVLPGLVVGDVGPIALPLLPAQAEELKQQCQQAPYGKGEKTLVDTRVRRVWRLTPDRFKLANPDWKEFLNHTVGTVQEELGLEGEQLEAHLYDLLLYEPGSFFLPHRDGEKLDRMVATLVVVLPSSHQGGELVVRHDGHEQTVDFSTAENGLFRVHFAAFYADCEHEIRPLRTGHRLALVYNLTLAESDGPIAAPRSSEHVAEIVGILQRWSQDEEAGKMVITLDHQYTQEGLAWDALKGTDRAQASVLRQAARQAGCQAHLALLTYWLHGAAEYDGSHGRRGYGDDAGGEEHIMGEVFDSSLTADHWVDPEGNRLALGEMPVDEEELVDPEALTEVDPEEDFEGYTGNAGMTLERWYRHAAVILWPDKLHFEILCECGAAHLVPALKVLVARWQQASGDDADKFQAQSSELASLMIDRWPERQFATRDTEKLATGDLLELLSTLDESRLTRVFLSKVMIKDASVDPGKSLAEVCARHGWQTFQPQLVTLFEATALETLMRNVRLLEHLCTAQGSDIADWRELCSAVAEAFVLALERIDAKREAGDWRVRDLDRGEVLASLARSLIAGDQPSLLSRVVDHALAAPDLYGLTEAHVAALGRLRPWLKERLKSPSAVLAKWVAACRDQLEARTAAAPRKPDNLRRPAELTCKCGDCAGLKMFLQSADEAVYRFRARQERRSHMADVIRDSRCDLDCATDRRGSPQTLVCTKNTASYERSLETYRQDQEHLAMIEEVDESLGS